MAGIAVRETHPQPERRGHCRALEREHRLASLLGVGAIRAAAAVRCHADRVLPAPFGEAGVEELLAITVEASVAMTAIKPAEFECVIVDVTAQGNAIADLVGSRLLEVARVKVARLAQRAGGYIPR